MNVFLHILFAATATTIILLAWYLLVLLNRTGFMTHATSIGHDVIVGFHLISISALCASILLQKHLELKYGWILVLAAIAVEIIFFLMNWFGYVWEYQKGAPNSLHIALVELIRKFIK